MLIKLVFFVIRTQSMKTLLAYNPDINFVIERLYPPSLFLDCRKYLNNGPTLSSCMYFIYEQSTCMEKRVVYYSSVYGESL